MLKDMQLYLCILFVFACGLFYELSIEPGCFFDCKPISKKFLTQEEVMAQHKKVIFLETNRLHPPPLVLCSVESAARIYIDRPIVFFIKGLDNNTLVDIKTSYSALSALSAMNNVFIFPLKMDILFQGTPLLPWYLQVNTTQEKYWVYVSSDASRLALVWRYGGTYMDTDVISIRPIPMENFLAAESSQFSSNGVFGFQQHNQFLWDCMNNFVANYNGDLWGNQGPYLMTRMLKGLCNLTDFQNMEDHRCHNISFLHPQRFYPIPYQNWERYYEVWESMPDFNNSYALHLWNFMNHDKKNMTIGSNTLVENIYKTYCPTTYWSLVQAAEGSKESSLNGTT